MIGIGLYANHEKEKYFKTTNASFISPTPVTQIIEDFTTTCKMVFSIVMLFRNFSQHDHLPTYILHSYKLETSKHHYFAL